MQDKPSRILHLQNPINVTIISIIAYIDSPEALAILKEYFLIAIKTAQYTALNLTTVSTSLLSPEILEIWF